MYLSNMIACASFSLSCSILASSLSGLSASFSVYLSIFFCKRALLYPGICSSTRANT